MSNFTQAKSTLLSHAAVTHPNSVEGTPVSVATALSCLVVMWHALVEATANTNPGTFRIFGSFDAAGQDDGWFHILDIDVTTAAATTIAFTATEAAGTKVCAVAGVGAYLARDNIYVINTTLLNSEWHTIDKVVASTSIDIMVGLENEQTAAASDFWSDAQQFRIALDCSGLSRIRVDFSHEGATGANCHIKAEVNIATDIS